MGFGRKGERVAKTPIRVLPPSRGGRTVGEVLRFFLRGLPDGPVKDPDEPDVGEVLQAPEGVRVLIGRFENNVSLQLLHQPALPGHAEFFGEITVDMGNGRHGKFLGHGGTSCDHSPSQDGAELLS